MGFACAKPSGRIPRDYNANKTKFNGKQHKVEGLLLLSVNNNKISVNNIFFK